MQSPTTTEEIALLIALTLLIVIQIGIGCFVACIYCHAVDCKVRIEDSDEKAEK